jgi:hypothetical protein
MPAPSPLQDLIDSINRDHLWEAPVELQQFAKEETFHQQGGHERRRFRRYSLITNVIAVPLDEELRPVGPQFVALSSGMSVDGLRLIHTQPAAFDRLFIEIDGQPVRFVLSVLRSRPVGCCFEIAGRLTSATALNQQAVLHEQAELSARMELPIAALNSDDAARVAFATATPERSLPSHDDFWHWAGVTAAVELLKRPGRGFSR